MSQRIPQRRELAGVCAIGSFDPITRKFTRIGGPCNPPIAPIDPEPRFPSPSPILPPGPFPRRTPIPVPRTRVPRKPTPRIRLIQKKVTPRRLTASQRRRIARAKIRARLRTAPRKTRRRTTRRRRTTASQRRRASRRSTRRRRR